MIVSRGNRVVAPSLVISEKTPQLGERFATSTMPRQIRSWLTGELDRSETILMRCNASSNLALTFLRSYLH